MIVAQDVELRAGRGSCSSTPPSGSAAGDRVGLVGRNGAGKTTLTRVLAGEGQPAAGTVTRTGDVGYLPQDPRTGDLEQLARDRVLSARGLDEVIRRMRETEGAMASADDETRDAAMARYGRLDAEFTARGGYAAESEAATICSSLGLPERVLDPGARHALRRPAAPGRARPDPVLRGARRCSWTSRRTTSTPTPSSGCATSCGPGPAGWS